MKDFSLALLIFVQLCLEGYYDDIIFHRIIKDFLVQDGDPTGTGTSGESIYGGAFVDEHHSRIRFKHRGLAACANEGRPHSNGSPFFITLDRCNWLDKKHTIFGKVYDNISFHNLLGFANDIQMSVRDALSSKKDSSLRESGAGFFSSSKESDDDNDEDEVSFDARMHRQLLNKTRGDGRSTIQVKVTRWCLCRLYALHYVCTCVCSCGKL